jgi:hypothetical protein
MIAYDVLLSIFAHVLVSAATDRSIIAISQHRPQRSILEAEASQTWASPRPSSNLPESSSTRIGLGFGISHY